jgi:hypothetical protein
MDECRICGGETREGEAFINISIPTESGSFGGGMMPFPGGGMPTGETEREARLHWREKTGKEKGWLIKSAETKTMNIKGKRCLECGYIEFYVEE